MKRRKPSNFKLLLAMNKNCKSGVKEPLKEPIITAPAMRVAYSLFWKARGFPTPPNIWE